MDLLTGFIMIRFLFSVKIIFVVSALPRFIMFNSVLFSDWVKVRKHIIYSRLRDPRAFVFARLLLVLFSVHFSIVLLFARLINNYKQSKRLNKKVDCNVYLLTGGL